MSALPESEVVRPLTFPLVVCSLIACRQFHGTAKPKAAAPIAEPVRLPLTYPGLGTTRHLDRRLSERVMAGAVSLQLLTCFFGTAHIQLPVVDFPNFSERYNAANGDPRIMAIMANGGDPEQGIASAIPPAPGLSTATWPDTKRSRISTPGTVETLVAAMHAWAAHYCDMPIAFGSEAAAFGFPASAQTSGMLGLGMPHEMRLGGPDGQRPVTSEAESGPGRGPWRAERAKEMLKWGRARRAFCQGMLDKALALVDRHGLMRSVFRASLLAFAFPWVGH